MGIFQKAGQPFWIGWPSNPVQMRKANNDFWPIVVLLYLHLKVLADNIYVLCKSPMAKSITLRTLAGYSGAKTNIVYIKDLIPKLQQNWYQSLLDKADFLLLQ